MTGESRGSGVFASVKARRVLLVDDHVDSAELLAEVLAAQGHEVRIAYDPARAIKIGAELRPQVAILDISLPGMSGYELLALLQPKPEFAECRFIALTGHNERADRVRSREAGFQTHLTKPFDLRAVLNAVAGAAESTRSSSAGISRF
ncbi:MAG TPA: response regulator [Polyangiaceae bacterium]|jgi:CheY-like chemotaxis protein|nr:response regulator [Polyangiaceae bacterium]